VNTLKTVVQILAEPALRDGRFEIHVRRGQQAHVGLHRLAAAGTLEALILEQTQDFALCQSGHCRLSRRGRSCRRCKLLELADAPPVGPGECALFVAEEFAFEQLFGMGRTVDRQKRRGGTAAVLVDVAGDEFLAGARSRR